jgi:hypothetical protein
LYVFFMRSISFIKEIVEERVKETISVPNISNTYILV